MIINVPDNSAPLPIIFYTLSPKFRQGKVTRPAGCEFHQILFVLSGEGSLNCRGREYSLKRGNAFFTLSDTPVSYSSKDSLTVAFLTVTGRAIKDLAAFYNNDGILFYENIDTKKYLAEILNIQNEFYTFKREGVLSSMCYSLFVNFFEEQFIGSTDTDKAVIYIAKNFNKKISLTKIAQNCGVSVSKLCHDFKKTFNKTVFEYILDLRLSYARNIFSTNNSAKTKDVAVSSGFNDISYFCKAYKQKFKVSPSEDKEYIIKKQ